jgi:ELWxxDGT repeat protein
MGVIVTVMKIATDTAASHFAKNDNRSLENEFGAALVEKNGVCCFIVAVILLAFSATSVMARVDSPEDTSLIASSPNVTAGRAVTFNNRAYIVVDDGIHGEELWSTDGTDAGTFLVRDINPGPASSRIFGLTVVGSVLFFTADDGTHGWELWRSDGTPQGTILVKDIAPGADSSLPGDFAAVNGILYFSATRSSTGRELWKSDGSAANTVLVADLMPGSGGSDPMEITAVGANIFFSATAPAGNKRRSTFIGRELWKTDGTAAGTVLVKDIWPGFGSSAPSNLVAVNNLLFFNASMSSLGNELWRSDGTNAGTVLVKDLTPGSASSSFGHMRTHNGQLFFEANGQLWKSDGTTQGTVPATDFAPGLPAGRSIFADFAILGSRIVFTAFSEDGTELWSTNGTAGSTQFLRLMVPSGEQFVEIQRLFLATGDRFYFNAFDPATGTELYATDGTPAGTRLVRDFFPDQSNSSVVPLYLTGVNGAAFLSADEGISGRELWISRGVPGDPRIVHDFLRD